MEEKQSGSGDKIGRQINMGDNSTYYESQNPPKEIANNSNHKLPETPSGFFGLLFGSIPKPLNWFIALLMLGLASFIAYRYFIPKKEEVKVITQPVEPKTIVPYKTKEPSPKAVKPTSKSDVKNHFESHDQSKQINVPDNNGTININQ
jgi:hypothetical protein